MTSLVCAAIGLLAVALCWWRYSWIVSPDGAAYLAMANGAPAPAPFRWRLLPRILGRWPAVWRWCSWASLVVSAVLVGAYAEQRGIPGWSAAGLFCALPWFRGLVRMPILTDQLAMVFALGSALSPPCLAVPLAIVAGCCSERAPVFAAVFAWSPLPLVGLVVPAVMALTTRGPSSAHNSLRTMRELHNRAQPHVYAQLLVATDRARLYQWGAPVVVVSALSALPPAWWPAAILATVISPASDWVAPWK